MKISFLSDIHIDMNGDYPVLDAIAALPCDVLVLAGDISENAGRTREAIQILKERMRIPVYYIPGNHDMWSIDRNADRVYRLYQEDPDCLCRKPVLLEGKHETFALIGDIGWYDYTFGESCFSKEDFDRMSRHGRIWQDQIRNNWTADNQKKCAEMLSILEQQMDAYKAYPQIVVTHMLPIREFCVPLPDEIWCYFNAFLGSARFDELYRRYPVRYSVCGHVHYRRTLSKDGITYICPCLGYAREWPDTDPALSALAQVKKQTGDAVVTVEL